MAIQTFTTGQVLTAAQMNTLQQQAVMTFTTEAARDAALTSPTEGMVAYLTAPTVPAATGGTTSLPTGVRTIYNGTNWVCITPVSAFTADQGTTTSLTYTATLSGSPGTNPSVTLVTGTTALVSIRSLVDQNTVGSYAIVSVAVSGAGTVAASNNNSLYFSKSSNASINAGTTFVITGLTAGTNTFTLQYKADVSGTATFLARGIIVQGIA
jgi:hypothetical protein